MLLLIKNITLILTALLVLATSNGFILENYFCAGCNEEHQEIAFFEFGELNHKHAPCNTCVENHQSCSCHLDEHLNHASVSYYSLDDLFFSATKIKTYQNTVISLIPDFISTPNINKISISKNFKSGFDPPPLIPFKAGSAIFSAVICIFRL